MVSFTDTVHCSGVPVAAPAVAGATALRAFGSTSCMLDAAGVASCWGLPPLGDGSTEYELCPAFPVGSWCSSDPVRVAVDPIASDVDGAAHRCVVTNGSVYCWGDNSRGQLGDGTTEARSLPTLVVSSAP